MASSTSSSKNPKAGPKIWNNDELRIADALGCTRAIRKTDLSNDVHTMFERKRWLGITDADYTLLLPSIRLATSLLEIGMPYLTNFLPSNQIHDKFETGLPNEENYGAFASHYHITLKPMDEITNEALQSTRGELVGIAEFVTWRVDDTMFTNKSWLGITRLVSDVYAPPPYKDLTAGIILAADSDSQDQGLPRRTLLVGIMQEYVDALRRYKEDTEPHIRARFLAGYTMAHEIGHVVWAQDYRSTKYSEQGTEPWVADDPISELGSSFMSWVFGGYDPNIKGKQDLNLKGKHYRMFESHLMWTYRSKVGGRRPTDLYETQWSISLKYMEDILNQSVWDAIIQPDEKALLEARRAKFKPDLTSSATATKAEWTTERGYPAWTRSVLSERLSPREDPKSITAEELKFMLVVDAKKYEDDEEELFALPEDDMKDIDINALPVRAISDGVLRQDMELNGGRIKANLTRVEVRYRTQDPRLLATNKRPRSGDDDDENNSSNSKRQRFSSYDPEDKQEVALREADKHVRFSDKQDYDCRDINQVLKSMSVEAVTGLTMHAAQLYCLKHEIAFPYPYEADAAWQDQRLNEIQHMHLISRIRMFRFLKAEEMFADAGNVRALALIKKARIDSLDHWMDEDIKITLEAYGQTGSDMVFSSSRDLLRTYYKREFYLLLMPEEQVKEDLEHDDPRAMNQEQQARFLEKYNLPIWGDFLAKRSRIEQYQREINHPEGVSRKSINRDAKGPVRRTDKDGIETYAWDVVLCATKVGTLKSELYRKAIFPSDCTMKLYFGTDQQNDLVDYKNGLGNYENSNWKDLWVSLQFPEPKPEPKPGPTKIIYTPRDLSFLRGPPLLANGNGKIVRGPGDSGDDAGTGSAGTITTTTNGKGKGKGKAVARSSPEPYEAPDYLKRQLHIIDHPEEKTLAELMESINNDHASMSQALQPGGGFDSSLKPNGTSRKVAGAAEMLDNLLDRKEGEEERREAIKYETTDPDDRPVLPARPLKIAEDNDGGLAPDGVGSSHMRDLYDLIPEDKNYEPPPSSPPSPLDSP